MRRAIIFDLDGTILDSFREGLHRVRVISELNGIKFTEEKRKKLISLWGISGVELLEKGLEIEKPLAEELYKNWETWDELEPVPLIRGAKNILKEISSDGFFNFVLTSRNTDNAIKVLELSGILHFFEAVVGIGGDKRKNILKIEHKKPSPLVFDPILSYISVEGLKREDCVFVGDTVIDAECGIKAGVQTVCVLTGGTKKEKFFEIGISEKNVLQSVADFTLWSQKHWF